MQELGEAALTLLAVSETSGNARLMLRRRWARSIRRRMWTEYAVRSKDILGVILWNVPKPVRHHPESLRTRKKACARAF